MSQHAVLSASASKRWLACPPSARLEAGFAEQSSPYAEEGTHAHAWAEMKLRHWYDVAPRSRRAQEEQELLKSPYHSAALEEAVGVYVELVKKKYKAARKRCRDAVLLIEQRLDFSRWVPEGFGTGDAVIIADGLLEVIDLKFGKGVRVEAEGNPQTRLYGLGAYEEIRMLYDIDAVRMTICQPRLEDGESSEDMSVEELSAWGDTAVAPAARAAYAGGGDFHPGEHCRFCRARAKCRARAEQALEVTKANFALQDPELLDAAEIAEALDRAKAYTDWIKDIQEYALSESLAGRKLPGWKVVEGRSNRAYADVDKVAEALKQAGFSEAVIYTRELLGLTALEKALGKKTVAEAIGGLIVKPQGKPTLVPETDKRPEFLPAEQLKQEFTEVI